MGPNTTGAHAGGGPLCQRHTQLDLFDEHYERISQAACDRGSSPLWDVDPSRGAPLLRTYFRVRGAVVSMVTAAQLHGLLRGPVRALWLGAPLRVYIPDVEPLELHAIRWSNRQPFEVGVADLAVPGGVIRCTLPERTIIDLINCSRYVGGAGTAIECLRTYFELGGTEARIRRLAASLRVSRPAMATLDTLLLALEDR